MHKDVETDFFHELTYESCKISHLDVSETSKLFLILNGALKIVFHEKVFKKCVMNHLK